MRKLVLIALLAVLVPRLSAQRAGFGVSHHRPVHSPGISPGISPAIFFADPFYSDALYREGYPVTSQPPIVILQAAPVPAPVPEHPATPAQPLMIELQGDRYVRVSGEETSTAAIITPTARDRVSNAPRRPEQHDGAVSQTTAGQESVPAVLVFRDGHREEVSDYTIADGVLYTHTDYYTAGSWNKKITLSSLNLPDTITANHSRNIKFQLPASPNEVIVRP